MSTDDKFVIFSYIHQNYILLLFHIVVLLYEFVNPYTVRVVKYVNGCILHVSA